MRQEFIDLYNAYTHEHLDRRAFMERLARLAGGTAAAAAIVRALAPNMAIAAIVAENDPRVAAEWTSYPGENAPIRAYLVRPKNAAGPHPAVVVIHENRGLNSHIEDVARRLALEGYVGLAPDLLSPAGGTPDDPDAAAKMINGLDMAQTVHNAVAAVDFMKTLPGTTGKVGIVGFCWGGGMVDRAAAEAGTKVAAAVAYYGPPPPADVAKRIKSPLLLHFGGLDNFVNPKVPAFEAALKEAHVPYTAYTYEGANHAFNNDTSAARYNKEAADLAWSRTIAFFKQHLGA